MSKKFTPRDPLAREAIEPANLNPAAAAPQQRNAVTPQRRGMAGPQVHHISRLG